jgi:uncharacterized phage infection (PIP) family protein YhgE
MRSSEAARTMNAILHEDYEAPVLTLEAIEVHLSYMRPGLAAVEAALPVLRDKIDELSARMDSKIDQANRDRAAGDTALSEKIDQLSAKVDERIEQLSTKFDTKFDQLSTEVDAKIAKVDTKIDQLSTEVDAKIAKVDTKIDQLSTKVDTKIDQLSTNVDAKIDQANKDRAAGDATLAAKIDTLTERVLEMQGNLKGLIWFISGVTLIASGVSIAHTLGWI